MGMMIRRNRAAKAVEQQTAVKTNDDECGLPFVDVPDKKEKPATVKKKAGRPKYR